jgi:ketosteroid isomerase-like protein
MSQENVELVRRALDAFNRRDVAALLELTDSEVETVTDLVSVEGHPYRGHSGVRDWFRDLLAVFPDFHAEILEARDHGDFVIALVRRSAHGLDSGTPIEENVWQASEWRNGKVLWWKVFATEAEALEAAGLQE